jgi:hypothetical protein
MSKNNLELCMTGIMSIFLIFGYPSITFPENQLAIKRINSHGSAKMYQFSKVKTTNFAD